MKRYYYSQECDDYTRLFRIAIGQPRFPLHQFRQQRIMQSGETPGCPFVGDDSIMQRTYKSAPNAQNGHGKYYQRNLAEVALAYLQEGGTVRCFVMTLRAAGEIVRFKQRAALPCAKMVVPYKQTEPPPLGQAGGSSRRERFPHRQSCKQPTHR